MICYACGRELNDQNQSKEHIINNSIGGQISSTTLLCITCNSDFGQTIDAVLNNQLSAIATVLGIKKDRLSKKKSRVRLKTKDGKEVEVGRNLVPLNKLSCNIPGKAPIIKFAYEGSEYNKEKNILKKTLGKKWRMYEKEWQEPPTSELYHIPLGSKKNDEPGTVLIGGKDYFRSVIKMCVNMYLHQGYDIKWCENPIKFIRDEIDFTTEYAYYYPSHYAIHYLGKDEVSHIIHLRGDPYFKLLYAYIELFSFENIIVVFNRNYDGENFSTTYCYDLLSHTTLDKTVKIKLGKHHFDILHLISQEGKTTHEQLMNRVMKIVEKSQLDNYAKEVAFNEEDVSGKVSMY